MNFNSTTQSIHIDSLNSSENSTITFRPIIPKVLTRNILSSTVDNLQTITNIEQQQQQDSASIYNNLSSTYRSLT